MIGLGISVLEQTSSLRAGEELTRITEDLRQVITDSAQLSADEAARRVRERLADPVESVQRQVSGLAEGAPGEMKRALDKVTGELSRMVAAEVTAALDPARPESPAAALVAAVSDRSRELGTVHAALTERMDALTGAQRSYDRSAYKGEDFEEEVADELIEALSASEYHVTRVGTTPGAQARVLAGDILISDAEHSPVLVIECKSGKITREQWGRELTAAQRNRNAPVALGVCGSLPANGGKAITSLTTERMVVAASEPGVLSAVVKLLLARYVAGKRAADNVQGVDAESLTALVETMADQVTSLGKAAEHAKTASDKARTASDTITRTAGALEKQIDLILHMLN